MKKFNVVYYNKCIQVIIFINSVRRTIILAKLRIACENLRHHYVILNITFIYGDIYV